MSRHRTPETQEKRRRERERQAKQHAKQVARLARKAQKRADKLAAQDEQQLQTEPIAPHETPPPAEKEP
jgi:hypothetical protein